MDKPKNRPIAGGSLNWQEREKIVKEYLTGSYTKQALWKKYTGQETEHGELLRWMRKLGYTSAEKRSIPMQQAIPSPIALSNAQEQDSEQQIKDLEQQLAMAQLEVEGYQIMIELAEKEFKIPIIKKSNTK